MDIGLGLRRGHTVIRVGFFLDQFRIEQNVDVAFYGRSSIIDQIDRASQLDKFGIKGMGRLLEANLVLNLP